jgi:hypothetical protein
MRRTLVAVVVGALLLAGCGEDDSGAQTVAVTDPATTQEPAPTTEAASDTTVAEEAALVPEVVCRGDDGEILFGYTSESSEPVVVEVGDANRLSGVASDANPLITTLFAPGSVDVAFWAFPPDGSSDDVVWTITGPDGVERSAAGGLTTEGCQDVFAAPAGAPALEVVGATLSADGESADVELRVTGLDEASVCNEAFTAEPRLVVINDGSALPTSFEPEATVNVGPLVESPDGASAQSRVYAFVLDQCSAAGVTAPSWSSEARHLNYGLAVCARLEEDATVTVSLTEGLCGLGGAGGTSIRPR